MSDASDHPDWFGADEAPDERSATEPAPEAADWFDDLEHADPSPVHEPWESGGAAGSAASTDGSTGGAAGSAADGDGSAGTASATAGASDRGADTGGAAPAAGDDTPGTTRERPDSRGGRDRRRSRQDGSSGGIIAWLKRLLGLN